MVKMPHWPLYFGPDPDITKSLDRMKLILNHLKNPQNKLKNIIHITGTKGKGSTAMFITKILLELGYKVNTYTSPHIYQANERFLINGMQISDDDLYLYTEKIRLTIKEIDLNLEDQVTSFEIMTLTAVMKFYDTIADFNIFEVGMGGLLDSTNIFDENKPIACIFTPIHLDHRIHLGQHPLEIAYHKLGILKDRIENCIVSLQGQDIIKYMKRIFQNFNIKNQFFYGIDFESFKIEENNENFIFERRNKETIILNKPSLIGEYQLINLATAIQTVQSLNLDKEITPKIINKATKNIIHYARMQEVPYSYFNTEIPINTKIYVDGGHNALAAKAISSFINENCRNKFKNTYIVLARSKNTSNTDMLSVFKENQNIKKIFAIRAIEPRPEPPEKIRKTGQDINLNIEIANNPEDCISEIFEYEKEPCLIIFCGSLYLGRFF